MYKQSLPRLISKGLVIEKQVKNNANKINVSLSCWRHLWSMQSHTKSFARIESDWTLRLVLQFWFMRFTAIRSHLNFYAKSNYAIDHAPCPRRQFFGSGLSDMFWSAILESLAAVLFFLFLMRAWYRWHPRQP